MPWWACLATLTPLETIQKHTGHSDAHRPVLRHRSALPVEAGTRGSRRDERAHLQHREELQRLLDVVDDVRATGAQPWEEQREQRRRHVVAVVDDDVERRQP